jgi:uncharacterized paraquat-inducible protein A
VRQGAHLTPVPAGRTSPLGCEDCGLIYSRGAIAREMTLATGVVCRRCGGTLEVARELPVRRSTVVAVRSALSGSILGARERQV